MFNIYIQPYGYDRLSTLLYFTLQFRLVKLTPFLITISALPRLPHYIIGVWPLGFYALLLQALILRVTHYRAIPPLLGLCVAPTPLPSPLLLLDPQLL